MARKKKSESMTVRFTTSMASPDRAFKVNDEVELPAAEAARLIEAGYAVPVAKPTEGRRQATA